MKLKTFTLLLLAGLAPARTQAICTRVPNTPGPILMQGSVVSCRSALPQIEAELERHRADREEWAQPLRDTLPNADRLPMLRPYDELKAGRLARVQGVIVTFVVESRRDMSADAAWHALPQPEQHDIFLRIGGSSCDLLPHPTPTVIVSDSVCCDVIPSGENSCLIGLPAASLPPDSLLETLRGDA